MMTDEARLLRAVRRIIRPLIKLLIARGIRLPAITSLLKQTYVEVALDDFRLADKPPTDSRISVLTGVHRKDVRSIRRDGVPTSAPPAMSLSATAVGRWLGDPDYADETGKPLVLHRLRENGSPSFEALVHGLSRDIHPRTVLDDLIGQELVAWDEDGDKVHLLSRAFVPAASPEELMKFFEMNLHDHLAAATTNLLQEDEKSPFLERAVYYNRLLPRSVDQLELEARKLGDDMLRRLNAEAFERQKADRRDEAASERFRFGIFFYRDTDERDSDRHEGDEP